MKRGDAHEYSTRLSGVSGYVLELQVCASVRGQAAVHLAAVGPADRGGHAAEGMGPAARGYECAEACGQGSGMGRLRLRQRHGHSARFRSADRGSVQDGGIAGGCRRAAVQYGTRPVPGGGSLYPERGGTDVAPLSRRLESRPSQTDIQIRPVCRPWADPPFPAGICCTSSATRPWGSSFHAAVRSTATSATSPLCSAIGYA